MKQNKKALQWTKTGAVIILALLFCFSVFVLAVYQYGIELFKERVQREIILKPITSDSQWYYMDGGFEPGVGNVWTTQRYDTTGWKRGSGVFAATEAANASNADVLLESGGSGATYFFRCEFDLDNSDGIEAMEGNILYSDAVLVYLNGEIIFAGNVPSGGYKSNQELGAADVFDEALESKFEVTDTSALRNGRNLLAVEVHQRDRARQTASFCFSDFSLTNMAGEEIAPDSSMIALEQGSSEEEVTVSWQTASEEFYQLEYLSEEMYDEKEEEQKQVQRVLMGRVRTPEGSYVNSATLSRLKIGTVYYYRLLKVGGTASTSWQQFQTAGNNSYRFTLLGDSPTGTSWQDITQKSVKYTGKPDFVLYAAGNQQGNESICLEQAGIFKNIPFAGVTTGIHRLWENECGYTFTFQDTLFIMLNDRENTLDDIQAFLQQAVNQNQRKWIIAAMYEAVPDMDKQRAAAYETMFRKNGVSLVLYGQDVDTSSLVQRGSTNEELYFVSGGISEAYSAVQIEVRRNRIIISRYNMEKGTKESERIVP